MPDVQKRKAIPKFTSYRPKSSSTDAKDTRDSENPSSGGTDQSYSRQKQFGPSEISSQHRTSRPSHRPPESTTGPKTFVIDTVGDHANVQYGSLHKYDIPHYRRSGRGSVLGVERHMKIDQKLSNEKHFVLASTQYEQTARSSRALWSRAQLSKGEYIRPASQHPSADDRPAEYISLQSKRANKRRRLDLAYFNEETSSAEDEASPVERQTKALDHADEDGHDKPSHDVDAESISVVLNRKIEQDPSNGQAWLDLIEYQSSLNSKANVTFGNDKAQASSTAELKTALAENALKNVKDPYYQQRLLQVYLQEGSQIWDTERLVRRWKDILSKHPQHGLLRIDYLNFLLTRSAPFVVNDAKEAFAAVIKDLKQLDSHDPDSLSCYILLRLTTFLREAGFGELANAIWLSNLEFNLFRPAAYRIAEDQSHREALPAFEEFWENEGPRLGEEQSLGWAASLMNPQGSPTAAIDPPLPFDDSINLVQWPKQERSAASRTSMPARTLDDVGENDPYRVILFSDISSFLVSLGYTSASHSILISAFCIFCGLPPASQNALVRQWWKDPFLRSPALDWPTTASSGQLSDFSASCPFVRFDTATAFNPDGWFSVFGDTKLAVSAWARKVLKQLVDAQLGGESLAEYVLSVEHAVESSASRKLAKSLIKRQPSNLRLYNAYAAIEASNKADSVDSTLETVIKMYPQHSDIGLIWLSRVWLRLQKGAFQEALTVLTRFPENDQASTQSSSRTALMHTQRALTDSRDRLLSLKDYDHVTHYIELLAILQYLHSEDSLQSALNSFTASLAFLPSSGETIIQRELIHQSRARVLHTHMTHTALYSPSVIRATLQESISLFPDNTIFLYLFANLEHQFRIDNRVRSTVQALLSAPDVSQKFTRTSSNTDNSTPVDNKPNPLLSNTTHDNHLSSSSVGSMITHSFAISVELRRAAATGGPIHSVRSAFERAVHSHNGRLNVGLWKWFFLFECERGELDKARNIFFRGIATCPWAKELYLLAFEKLSATMSVKELSGVYETMLDREIRIRIPLEDVFERLEEG